MVTDKDVERAEVAEAAENKDPLKENMLASMEKVLAGFDPVNIE